MTWMPDDWQQRKQALDITQSWIVQAPAGSGKTGILVYRILKLLAVAERPEQILAITFTRKAAKEMRDRLLELLAAAAADVVSDNPFEQQGLDLAKAVLHRDAERDWRLLDMPNRLNIETIDALCARLVSYMPWLSRLGERPNTTEHAQEHFQFAVEQLFSELLDQQSPVHDDLRQLMLSLDNQYARLKSLLITMLGKRDQWLRYFIGHSSLNSLDARQVLEDSWLMISQHQLTHLLASVPIGAKDVIIQSAQSAADVLLTNHQATPPAERKPFNCAFQCFIQDNRFPKADFADIEKWLGVKHLLLTNQGGLRKRVDKNLGFLPKTAEKERVENLLRSLENEPEFIAQLARVHHVPSPSFTDQQWQQLLSLQNVLRRLLSHLQLRFHNARECDFSEVAQRANLALNELDKPTDLALRMDYQIQHILVDEYQDTSHAQSNLLENLTRGWQRGDGRTLFLVGDPMQSIYRFREADVGLFLKATNATGAINDIELKPLVLTENFRSQRTLVDWFNRVFLASFPKQNDEMTGAIIYSPASSHKQSGDGPELRAFHSEQDEAQYVVTTVQQALRRGDNSIAILVRSRGQLAPILPALTAAGIAYQGVDIQPLNKTQSVLDVIALCKALLRLDDKVSWLALLRSPMVGLSLAELTELVAGKEALVWDRLHDSRRVDRLSQESTLRLKRFLTVMTAALKQKQQLSLAGLTQWTWFALGGEQTLTDIDIDDLHAIWTLIQETEVGGDIAAIEELEVGLDGLFAQSGGAGADQSPSVVVSTIHKAKGLQYTTVILPSLSRKGQNNDKDIVRWAEMVDDGQKHLLMAPLTSYATNDKANSHYEYLQQLEKQRDRNERLRLLYVACTRAESYLYLSGQFRVKNDELMAPGLTQSLLADTWGYLHDKFLLDGELIDDDDSERRLLEQTLSRLPANYVVPKQSNICWQNPNAHAVSQDNENRDIVYEWASSIAQTTGVLLHQWLEHHGDTLVSYQLDETQKAHWRAELAALNLAPEKIPAAVKRLSIAIDTMQNDARAQWIFASHTQARNEYAISSVDKGLIKHHRIDRTFIDEDGNRWIIDYKSTTHLGDDLEQFIDQQLIERGYIDQLNRYAKAFSQLEDRPIKLGIYFPLLTQWREWCYE